MNRPALPADESLRLFVAIELPQSWREGLGALIEKQRRALAAEEATAGVRLRWVRPEGIHITLKFLGQVSASHLPAVEQALAEAVAAPPGIVLRGGKPGSFGGAQTRVLWVGVEGALDGLQSLATRVDIALATAGFEREKRPLAPHLTLARLPEALAPALRRRVATLALEQSVPPLPPFSVEEVSLTRSHLGPGGARYERLAAFPGSVTR